MADTQPPRRVVMPPTEQSAPDNLPGEGKTPAHGILMPDQTIPYIKRQVQKGVDLALEQAKELDEEDKHDVKKSSTLKTLAGFIGAVIAAAIINLFSNCNHETKDTEDKSSVQAQLDKHVKKEEEHFDQTTKMLNTLIERDLKEKK